MKNIRKGIAQIKVIENGFLLHHDYPHLHQTSYFATIDELCLFLKNYVFKEVEGH